LFAKVVDGKVITSFVPTVVQRAPPEAEYEDVYDRTHALNYIIRRNIRGGMTKIKENKNLISGIQEGEKVDEPENLIL